MINQDVIDLYERGEPGARVVVLGAPGAVAAEAFAQADPRGGYGLPPLHQLVRDPEALARLLWR
jgi:hypothetical protein